MISPTTIDSRIRELNNFAKALRAEKNHLAEYLVKQVGITLNDKLWEVDFSAKTLENFEKEKPLIIPRSSLGNKAIFIPYNDPIFSLATGLGPAYLASEEGDKIILKFPVEKLPELADFMKQSIDENLNGIEFFDGNGREFIDYIPNTDVNVIMLYGHHSWVEPLEPIFRASGQKVIFEGGSKNPFIIAKDADVELAAETAYKNNILFSGQACFSSKRFYVHKSQMKDFKEKIMHLMKDTKCGDPLNPETRVGANNSKKAVDYILNQIEHAKIDGAFVEGGDYYTRNVAGKTMMILEPAMVYNCDSNMEIMRDETFGPVMAVQKYDDEKELYKNVINSEYGLILTLFGNLEDQQIQQRLERSHGYFFHNTSMVDFLMSREHGWHEQWKGYGKSAWTWERKEDGTFSRTQGPEYFVKKFSKQEPIIGI